MSPWVKKISWHWFRLFKQSNILNPLACESVPQSQEPGSHTISSKQLRFLAQSSCWRGSWPDFTDCALQDFPLSCPTRHFCLFHLLSGSLNSCLSFHRATFHFCGHTLWSLGLCCEVSKENICSLKGTANCPLGSHQSCQWLPLPAPCLRVPNENVVSSGICWPAVFGTVSGSSGLNEQVYCLLICLWYYSLVIYAAQRYPLTH